MTLTQRQKKSWTRRRNVYLLFESRYFKSWPFNQQQRMFCLYLSALSVLDPEPCQPVWAVGQKLLSSNASCANTIVGYYSETIASWAGQ